MTKRLFKCILLASLITLALCSVSFIAAYFVFFSRGNNTEAPDNFWELFAIAAHIVVLLLIVITAVAAVIAGNMSKKAMQRLNDLSVSSPGQASEFPELEPLITRLRRQNTLIRDQMTELTRRHDEFHSITEGMSEGFIIVDSDLRVISYNSAAYEIFGFNDPQRGIASCEEAFSAISYAAKGHSCEREFQLGNRHYRIFASPARSSSYGAAVAIVLDVTERAEREAMRREFSSNISHELKTPLTSIHGAAEMLKSGMVKPEDTANFGRMIFDESGRLISLVQDILRISQIDEGKLAEDNTDIDLYKLSESVISRLSHVAKSRNISFSLIGESAIVRGSEGFLEDLVYNLADNAVKYNKDGGSVTVSVSTVNSHPVLEISDTGIGIPQDQIGRVFERFYRVDKSRSKAIGGTGLGLSIVKHAVAYHKADISIESEVGIGTKVIVVFP